MSISKKNILLSLTAAIISFVTVIISFLVLGYFSSFKKEAGNNDSVKKKQELVNDPLLIKLDSLLKQKEYYRGLLEKEIAGREGGSRVPGFGARAKYLEKIIDDINKEIEGIIPLDTTKSSLVLLDTIPIITNDPIRGNNALESEILEIIEQYNSMVKTKNILQFYLIKLKDYYKVKGLSYEANILLRSTITEINEELNKLNKSAIAPTAADNLRSETNETTDSFTVRKQIESDTINSQ